MTEHDKAILAAMTLEELWQLFPIELAQYDPVRAHWAEEEITSLHDILTAFDPLINHIGSTAIPGIVAKPIVDILVEVRETVAYEELIPLMESHGYICMARSDRRLSFNKGYTPRGFASKVFHVHVHREGDNAEVLFRDYLIAHPDVAREYETLKLSLLPRYRHDRDGYTAAKTHFIIQVLTLARTTSQQL